MVTLDIARRNPGCLAFVIEAYEKNFMKAEGAFQRMQDAGITGARLYMLWNDCCDRDTDKALEVMAGKEINCILHHIDGGGGRGIPFTDGEEARDEN